MSTRDQVIALAGVFQGARLARDTARQGRAPDSALAASLDSLFRIDADSAEDVYGGIAGIRYGLEALIRHLGAEVDPGLLRQVLGLLTLERRLARRRDLQVLIRAGVQAAERQSELAGPDHDSVLAQLAEVYTQSISTLRPRLIIPGRPEFLEQPRLVACIRASLLAGIRAAVLWRQVGGTRWRLLLTSGRLLTTARELAGQA